MMVKIGVVIPARNEEKYIGKTLASISNQSLKPDKVVVVDDGSSDRTAEIAKQFSVTVLSRPDRGYNALGLPSETVPWNFGLKFLDKISDIDYVMMLAADQILARDYIEKIIAMMEKNRRVILASGRIIGEMARAPRGSGRIYRFAFLRDIGFFPANYGAESYTMCKALEKGYEIRVVQNAISFGQRRTSSSCKKMYALGKGKKALGDDPIYVLWDFILTFFESPRGAVTMLSGYLSSGVQKYPDLNFGKWQRSTLIKRLLSKIRLRRDMFSPKKKC
jgi:glycosyltransferase involved in cell wall biosynthesis